MKKKLKVKREVIRNLEAVQGAGLCTIYCTEGIDCGQPSGYIECRPNYTCGRNCIPY